MEFEPKKGQPVLKRDEKMQQKRSFRDDQCRLESEIDTSLHQDSKVKHTYLRIIYSSRF